MKLPQNEVDKAIYLFRFVKRTIVACRSALYTVFISESWKGRFSSWDEFVESSDGLDISRGLASRLLAVEKYYVIDNGFSGERLVGIDNEKLYLAIHLPVPIAKQLASASTLSRSELKQELYESKNGECENHIPLTICSRCHIRL